MEEKVKNLRKHLIENLKYADENKPVLITEYEPDVLDLLLFCTRGKKCLVDEYGKRKKGKKIFALPKEILKKIDFSNVSFDDFDAINYDFSDLHGVKLNPEGMNLAYATLKGVEFIGGFDNSIIVGANFAGSKGAYLDVRKLRYQHFPIKWFHNVVVCNLANCKFKDVYFINPLKYKHIADNLKTEGFDSEKIYLVYKIKGADFTGSINAKIYPEYLVEGLDNCTLKDATLVGDIFTTIKNTNFEGAKSKWFFFSSQKDYVEINPQSIGSRNIITEEQEKEQKKEQKSKSIIHANLQNVKLRGKFDNIYLEDVNFTNSEDAFIDLRTLDQNTKIETINFTDCKEVIGYDGKFALIVENGKIGKTMENKIDTTYAKKYKNNNYKN